MCIFIFFTHTYLPTNQPTYLHTHVFMHVHGLYIFITERPPTKNLAEH